MIKKRHISALALAFCVATSLIVASVGYDPWIDLDDDGDIDPDDFAIFAGQYGTSGTPINKTALLLELETRLNRLNKTLLSEYYTITDCDSLFALLSHLHSGDDISGGTLRADQIKIGSSEASHIIYFYEDGSEVGEWICWHDTNDRFWVSEDIYIEGDMQVQGAITIPTTTRYYSIPPSAWMPNESTQHFYRTSVQAYSQSPGLTWWHIPVNLPHGAVVTEFEAWVWDSYGVYDIHVDLVRTTEAGSEQGMADISTFGTTGGWVAYNDTSIDHATIDNENYVYTVQGRTWTPGTMDIFHRLGRVRITYNVTETLP